ncbi:MAG: LysR family transcriptional regulator [Mesorhizobium sp.]|nr:LysR family transcriptional regulator [Mesorhizobium sp.]MCO5162425.1 LysR family transcriptional regulator [Mesorhizobium sp.]
MLDWNDFRSFLAVLKTGNALAASKELRVSQTTVARRIEALEVALGLELFDKRRTGYAPNEAARSLGDAALAVETAASSFETLAAQLKRGLAGVVRLTTSQIMADYLLSPALRGFHERYPDLRLEVVAEHRFLDLSRGEADVALRAVIGAKAQPGLVGRRLSADRFSVYCSRAYAERYGIPRSGAELRDHTLIMAEPGRYRVPIAEWIYTQVTPAEVAQFRNNVAGIFSDIKAGHGVSVMSDVLAKCDPDFVLCFTPDIDQPHEIWLLTHERLREVPRVRAVLDFLAGHFSRHPAFRQALQRNG